MTSSPTPSPTSLAAGAVAVSIVVPIRDAEAYLDDCLESLRGQTMPNIEILCYDDASTDASARIVERHAELDARVKLVCYPEQRSSSQARKDGALAATGRYLMFVDADDYLDPQACERLVPEMGRADVDILQFGTTVINVGQASAARVENLAALLAPVTKRLDGDQPFEACFIRGEYGHSLWNKIYRTSFAKHAFAQIPDGSFPKAQDLLAYYVLAWNATSYAGIPDPFYNYRFGAGITGAAELTLERMQVFATQALVADAVDAFTAGRSGQKSGPAAARLVRRRLVGDCVMQWFRHLPAEDGAAGFDILAGSWQMADLTDALHRSLPGRQAEAAARIAGAASLRVTRRPVSPGSTIGLFYHRLTIGGLPRVLCILTQLYLDMGHRVVVLLDEEHPGAEFTLPDEVVRVQLPIPADDGGYRGRADRLQRALTEHGIDLLVYCAASSPLLLCDLLITKGLGVPFVLSIHDSAFHSLLNSSPGTATRPKVARLADAAQVLSEAEEAFWRSQGVKAVFLPNPVTTGIVAAAELAPEPGNLLWVGRLDQWVKQCLELPRIMAVVRRTHPEAKLHVVGKEWTPGIRAKLTKQIERLGVEENVIICDPTFDIEQYYRRASVVLITSVTECSPMTVVEARAYGIPIAMYRLPHIAMLRDGLGFVAAPQGDHEELGRAVGRLLDDEPRRRALGDAGREGLARFMEVDLAAQWRELFRRAADPDAPGDSAPVDIDVLGSLLANALDIYQVSLRRRTAHTQRLQRQITKLESALRKEQAKPKAAGQRVRAVVRKLRRRLGTAVKRVRKLA